MYKILVLANKDNVIYNFRSEVMLALQEHGYEVVFVCPYGEKLDYFLDKGFRNIDIRIDRRGKNVVKDLKLLLDYFVIFKKEEPDMILTYTAKPSYYGSFVAKCMKIKHIVNNCGVMEVSGAFKLFLECLYKVCENKADCIMFQNTYERDYTMGLLKWKNRYRDIPGSGVNVTEYHFEQYPVESDIIIFNFVARIIKLKGIEEFLECAKIIKSKYENAEFRIFGDFDDDSYRSIVEEYEKLGIVKYMGVVMDIKPYIKEANAVIHPSYCEGMTNVVLEHSSMGRPSIGSNIPGVKEGIDDNVTGYLFKVKDSASMVNAVEKFINLSYEKKKKMGEKAREKMEKHFNREIVIKTYLEEIDRLLN